MQRTGKLANRVTHANSVVVKRDQNTGRWVDVKVDVSRYPRADDAVPTAAEIEARSATALAVMSKPLPADVKAKLAAFRGPLACGPKA